MPYYTSSQGLRRDLTSHYGVLWALFQPELRSLLAYAIGHSLEPRGLVPRFSAVQTLGARGRRGPGAQTYGHLHDHVGTSVRQRIWGTPGPEYQKICTPETQNNRKICGKKFLPQKFGPQNPRSRRLQGACNARSRDPQQLPPQAQNRYNSPERDYTVQERKVN